MPQNTHISHRAYQPKLRMRGFTLIEVLITVAIVGILAAVAYPNYGQYVQNSRRTDGRLALLQEIQTLERCKSTRYSYANCTLSNDESPESYYALTMVSTATTYTVTATAQGTQTTDPECSVMAITNQGVQTPDPESTRCWPN